MANGSGLAAIEHVVVLMLENRSFDHMLGFLYPGNVTPSGQPFDGLTGTESNPGSNGQPVTVFKIEPTTPSAYYMPGADPGEGYKTVEQRWNLAALTASDAAAPGFGDVFTLSAPRTDDVLAGVTVPVASGPAPAAGTVSHLESIRAELISRQFPAGVSGNPRPA